MMQIISVISASHTATEGVIDLVLEADIGNGTETLPFTYSPADPYGLAPLVGAWLAANPAFPIADYEAPVPSTDPVDYPLSMRQLRLGLKQFGGKPASFLRDLIEGMGEGDAKDEAEIWYEETSVVHWEHPMTQSLMALAGISPEAGAAMWMQAKDLAA